MHGKKFLYTEIYEQLRAQIERGELLPEDRLPSEEALAEAHSVSRITVKKALERLKEDGLIHRVQGRGTFVSRAMPAERKPQEARRSRQLIGIVLEHVSSAFGLNMMYYMIQALDKAGYKTCIRFTFGSTEKESVEIDDLLAMDVAGLIIMPCHDSHYNLTILRLILENFPVVLVDKRMHGLPVRSVSTDGREAMRRLTHHLWERGCKTAALLTIDPASTSSLGDRAEGFYTGLEETGMNRIDECILPRRSNGAMSRPSAPISTACRPSRTALSARNTPLPAHSTPPLRRAASFPEGISAHAASTKMNWPHAAPILRTCGRTSRISPGRPWTSC